MATPKRLHKIRDYDATRRKLLETVGEILRDTGYAGLKTNNIARRAGKDKSLIRYYFQSLVNLQKTYIRENDYWFAFFENFTIPENPGREELKILFIDLMKANFSFFRENIEMQKIILWQISESNPLMRSVSDHRELEGGKLLGMTDPYFRDSDINFRALIAIILGGTYYLALHAETNKSTVCGIDINLEKDRLAVMTCIEQLVSRAWEEKNESPPALQEEEPDDNADLLEQLASALSLPGQSGNDPVIKAQFAVEAKRLQAAILRQAQTIDNDEKLCNYLRVKIFCLATLCDRLYLAGPASAEALSVLDIIYGISTPFFAKIPGDVLLPVLFRIIEGEKLFSRWQQVEATLTKAGTDSLLIKLMSLPFTYFAAAEGQLKWAEYQYLAGFTSGIEKQSLEKETTLEEWMLLLVSLGYNHSRFTAWCFRLLRERVKGKTTAEATLALKEARLNLGSRRRASATSFEPRKPHIADEIDQWIGEELVILNGLPNSDPGSLTAKLEELQALYWQGPGSGGDKISRKENEQLKFIEAKLLILLEHVRYAMNDQAGSM